MKSIILIFFGIIMQMSPSIEVREATSAEMIKNIKVVKKMSGNMGFDENMGKFNWKAVRRISNFGYLFMPKERGVKFHKESIFGVKCVISEPEGEINENIIMYIHGGGFVSGSASSSKGYCSMLAKYGQCKVVAVDYSLSPENKYPKALEECLSVYKAILEQSPNSSVALVGESAGAALCLTVTHKILAENLKKPRGVIVHSPFVDFTNSLDRTISQIDDFTVKIGCLDALQSIYVGDADIKSPFVSAIYGDFKNFPPLFITCDSNETLYADSYFLYKKAVESGVNVRMIEMRNSFHAFATIGTGSPETMQILKECVEFIKQ